MIRHRIAFVLVGIVFLSHASWIARGQEAFDANVVDALEATVSTAIERAEKSVVVIGRRTKTDDDGDAPDDAFAAEEVGTGVIIDARGFVLTNYHLLGNPVQSIYAVSLDGNKFLAAQIKAADPWTDLAVLQFEAEQLSPIRLAPNRPLRKGKFVVALGNPYGILEEGSVSAAFGIISNLSRLKNRDGEPQTLYQHGQLIQTDADLPAASSGGPLIDLQGNMIGLMTSVQAIAGYDLEGSHAVFMDDNMKKIIDRLKSGQAPEFGFLGISPLRLSSEEIRLGAHGVKIGESDVFRHTPAGKAGLQRNDIITHYAGKPVQDPHHLVQLVSFSLPAQRVQIRARRIDPFLRRTRTIMRDVVLAKRPMIPDRIPISTKIPADWRGLRVDYSTVSSDFYELANRLPKEGAVLVVSVQPDSVAWQSGIREGDLLSKGNGTSVSEPTKFAELVGDLDGEVTFEVIRPNGSQEIIVIPAPSP